MTNPSWMLLNFVTLIVLLGAVYKSNGQATRSSEFLKDTSHLEELKSQGSLDRVEQFIEDSVAKWRSRDKREYVDYMFQVCSLLSSYRIGPQAKQAEMLSKYALSTLSDADLSLQKTVLFTQFLSQDPLAVDSRTWDSLRRKKAERWLATWHLIEQNQQTDFDFGDLPSLSVSPPRATGQDSGVAPESISDPMLRKEYQKAIAANNKKTLRYNLQYWLKENAQPFFLRAERYLIAAYSRPPEETEELGRLIDQNIGDPLIRQRILATVGKQKGN